MDDWKRDVAEKSLPAEPEEGRRIVSNRPEHGNVFESVVGFSDDGNTLVFQSTEMVHRCLPSSGYLEISPVFPLLKGGDWSYPLKKGDRGGFNSVSKS